MSDLDEDFAIVLDQIKKGLTKFPPDEQDIIHAWTTKLSEPSVSENQRKIKTEYLQTLLNMIVRNNGLEDPFDEKPPEGEIQPLKDVIKGTKGMTPKTGSPSKGPSPNKSPPRGFSPGRRISPPKKKTASGEKEGEPEETGKAGKSGETSPTHGDKGGGSREPSPTHGEKEKGSKESSPPHGEKGKGSREPSPTHGEKNVQGKAKFNYGRLPCARRVGEGTGAISKSKKPGPSVPEFFDTNPLNKFENYNEMAKVIARSKGQSFAEFVVAISMHTADYGVELRNAMKAETSNFREYVDHVLSQRIKDLTEVLNEEQNAELQKIKKDIDKWQLELSHCKKRIKDVIPDFDINLFKKDKNYLKKIFATDFNSGFPQDESAKFWKDENHIRLNWYCEVINKMSRCNARLVQELNEIKTKTLHLEAQESQKFQKYMQFLKTAIFECQKLKEERDRLSKENAILLSEIQDFGI